MFGQKGEHYVKLPIVRMFGIVVNAFPIGLTNCCTWCARDIVRTTNRFLNLTVKDRAVCECRYDNAFKVLTVLPWNYTASRVFMDAQIDGFITSLRKRSEYALGCLRGSSNSGLGVLSDRWDSPLHRKWIQLHTVI